MLRAGKAVLCSLSDLRHCIGTHAPNDRGRIGPTIRSNPTWTLLGRCLSASTENSKLGRTLLASHDPKEPLQKWSNCEFPPRGLTTREHRHRARQQQPQPRGAASCRVRDHGVRTEGRVRAEVSLGCESLELTDVLWEASASREHRGLQACLCSSNSGRQWLCDCERSLVAIRSSSLPSPYVNTPHHLKVSIRTSILRTETLRTRRHSTRSTSVFHRPRHRTPSIRKGQSAWPRINLHLVLAPPYLRQIISTSQLLEKGTVHHFARRRTASQLEIDRRRLACMHNWRMSF